MSSKATGAVADNHSMHMRASASFQLYGLSFGLTAFRFECVDFYQFQRTTAVYYEFFHRLPLCESKWR